MHRVVLFSLVCCLAFLVAGGAFAGKTATRAITPSPVYTAAQLGAPAGNDWLVHFGNIKGHRYSSLTQINKSNINNLGAAWNLHVSAAATTKPVAAPE